MNPKLLTRSTRKPPVGATIDWGHPMTRALCFALPFNEVGADSVHSLVGQTQGVLSGSTKPSWIGGQKTPISFPGGAATVGYLTFGAESFVQDLALDTAHPATFAFRVWAASGVSSSIAGRNDGNVVSPGWQIDISSGASLMYAKQQTNTNVRIFTLVPTDQFITVVILADGSLTAANQIFYINGRLQAHSSEANGIGTCTSDAANTLYVGRGNGNFAFGNNSLDGALDWFYIWKRMLNPAEISLLVREPYAFIRSPAPVFLGIGAGVGGGGGGGSAFNALLVSP